jgi:gamma-glutamylcyclotransferase
MSSQPPPRKAVYSPRKQYYFAYGSNLHLEQMATRCPSSKFIGRAILKDFRWHINQRGYANILPSKPQERSYVQGLVYELSEADEQKLDRSEGVAKRCYSKEYLSLRLNRTPPVLYRRPVSWIVNRGGPAASLREAKHAGYPVKEEMEEIKHNVLVYVSYEHRDDGEAKKEYAKRINDGLEDGRVLGISNEYVERVIRPYILSDKSTLPPKKFSRPFPRPDRNPRKRTVILKSYTRKSTHQMLKNGLKEVGSRVESHLRKSYI